MKNVLFVKMKIFKLIDYLTQFNPYLALAFCFHRNAATMVSILKQISQSFKKIEQKLAIIL